MRITLSAVAIVLALSGLASTSAQGAQAPVALGPDHKLLHGGRPAERVAFPAIRDWSTLKITLSRTPCFGFCPAYAVQIDGDGHVFYDGQSHVGTTGHAEAWISHAQVRRLYNAFRKARFFWLYDTYRAPVTDMPEAHIGISFDGRSMDVVDYLGTAIGMPRDVVDLETLIDKTARTQRWIKGDAPRTPKEY